MEKKREKKRKAKEKAEKEMAEIKAKERQVLVIDIDKNLDDYAAVYSEDEEDELMHRHYR